MEIRSIYCKHALFRTSFRSQKSEQEGDKGWNEEHGMQLHFNVSPTHTQSVTIHTRMRDDHVAMLQGSCSYATGREMMPKALSQRVPLHISVYVCSGVHQFPSQWIISIELHKAIDLWGWVTEGKLHAPFKLQLLHYIFPILYYPFSIFHGQRGQLINYHLYLIIISNRAQHEPSMYSPNFHINICNFPPSPTAALFPFLSQQKHTSLIFDLRPTLFSQGFSSYLKKKYM